VSVGGPVAADHDTTPVPGPRRGAVRAILAAGLAAGALDLAYVIVFYAIKFPAVGAVRVVQGIAAGAVGREAAAQGGAATVVLGVVLHFGIALGAAAVFHAASRVWRGLVARPWASGLGYGVAVWLFMNLVVLPLSATPPKARFSPVWPWILLAHATCVGPPIAWAVRRWGR
jgi:hypothetical protein